MTRYLITIILLSISTVCLGQDKLAPETMAKNACECFNKLEKGTIDERLDPCLSKPINENIEEIHKKYGPTEPVERIAIARYMLDVSIQMIHNCEKFYLELDSMYTNMYPVIEYFSVHERVEALSDSISSSHLSDSSKIPLLHEKIALLVKARELEEALMSIEQMANELSNESETYWVKAYVYRGMGQYDLALSEIDKYINSGNESSIIYKALIKRRKNGQ